MKNFLQKIAFSPRRAFLRFFLISIGILMILFSWWQSLISPQENSVILLIDNSFSMSVKDVENTPNVMDSRLEISKNFAKFFIEKIQNPLAIATFSRDLTLELPFTENKILMQNVISGISLQKYSGGSDFFSSISRLIDLYKSRGNTHILILSDMEFFETNSSEISIPKNFHLYFLGVGSRNGGFMLEGYSIDGNPLYKQFQGQNAISVLDEKNLKNLVSTFNSESFILESSLQNEEIFSKIFPKLQNSSKTFDFYGIFGIIILFFGIILNIYVMKNDENL